MASLVEEGRGPSAQEIRRRRPGRLPEDHGQGPEVRRFFVQRSCRWDWMLAQARVKLRRPFHSGGEAWSPIAGIQRCAIPVWTQLRSLHFRSR